MRLVVNGEKFQCTDIHTQTEKYIKLMISISAIDDSFSNTCTFIEIEVCQERLLLRMVTMSRP